MSIPDRLGDFRIVEEIGRGGFGIVYRAEQESLERPVALKVLYQHKVHTDEEIARFEREARAAARLDHGGVVSVYSWGQEGSDFYIAQKLVGDGKTIADELYLMKEAGEPPKGYFRQVAEWLATVAEALQHAHERGIVHRDVKPSNILLDEDNRPYLGDFGLAKVEDGLELSRTGDFAGSPYYMSPEQADSKRGQVDHRSDIYALGVTLYELLTLSPPFHGTTSHEIIRKILTEDPKRPTKIVPRVPADLETICLKAMEKARIHRYQSAEAVAHDLRCFLDGEPINAAPPSTVSRIVRTARRHRTKVGMFVLSAAILILVVIVIKESQGAQKQENASQVDQVRLTALEKKDETIQNLQTEGGASLDEAIDEALEANDLDKVRTLTAQRKAVTDFLEKGSSMLIDILPQIGDTQVVKDIGAAMQSEQLFGGLAQAQKFLEEQQAEGGEDAESDENLKLVSDWLGNVTSELEGFDLSAMGVNVKPEVPVDPRSTKGRSMAPPVPEGIGATLVDDKSGNADELQPFLDASTLDVFSPSELRKNPWLVPLQMQVLRARLNSHEQAAQSAPEQGSGAGS